MWNEKNAVHFLCTPKWRVRGYIAPPKMKVKVYMYPQMKKPVGMLQITYYSCHTVFRRHYSGYTCRRCSIQNLHYLFYTYRLNSIQIAQYPAYTIIRFHGIQHAHDILIALYSDHTMYRLQFSDCAIFRLQSIQITQFSDYTQGSPHIVKTGWLDLRAKWGKIWETYENQSKF